MVMPAWTRAMKGVPNVLGLSGLRKYRFTSNRLRSTHVIRMGGGARTVPAGTCSGGGSSGGSSGGGGGSSVVVVLVVVAEEW